MKTLICALCLLMVASCAFATTGTIDLYEGYNMFAIPKVAIEATPAEVFPGLPLAGYIEGYNPVTQSGIPYDAWEPELFGSLLLGEGYVFWVDSDTSVTFDSLEDGVPSAGVKTDMWISLPGFDSDFDGTPDTGGWHLVGNPYATAVDSNNIRFTDGKDLYTWQEAYDLELVTDNFQGTDAENQSGILVDLNRWESTEFLPFHAYSFWTNVPNLAIIFLAP